MSNLPISLEEFKVRLTKYPHISLIGEYVKYKEKTLFNCLFHGDFMKTPKGVIISGCASCNKASILKVIRDKNKTELISKANEKFNSFFDYSKVEYLNALTPVIITCPIHGDFEQIFNSHLERGCKKCNIDNGIRGLKDRIEHFILRFEECYKGKYKLFDIFNEYKSSHSKVTVLCDKHGKFTALPSNLLKGSACYHCGKDRLITSYIEGINVWSDSGWSKRAKISSNYDSFKVYILQFKKDSEIFFKIGKTYRKTKYRIKDFKNSGYTITVLGEKDFESGSKAGACERTLISMNNHNKYIPEIKFRGWTECFFKIEGYEEVFKNCNC